MRFAVQNALEFRTQRFAKKWSTTHLVSQENLCHALLIIFCFSEFLELHKPGQRPIFDESMEDELYSYIINNQRYGQPTNGREIKRAAWSIAEQQGKADLFGETGPSNGFLYRFLKRHPSLVARKPEGLSRAAAAVSKTDIQKWFALIKQTLIEDGYAEILEDPCRIFNCDESGFCLSPSKTSAYVEAGTKDVHHIQRGKEQVTVMFCFSASGYVTKPFIVLKGKRMSAELKNSVPEDVHVCLTENGWQTQRSFSTWIDLFNDEIIAHGIQKPVILFVDGHASHDSAEVNLLIGLYCLLIFLGKSKLDWEPQLFKQPVSSIQGAAFDRGNKCPFDFELER